MPNQEIIYSDSLNVVMANKLIRAIPETEQDKLTLFESKLIKLVVSQIAIEDEELYTYTCRLTHLCKFLGIGKATAFEEIDALTTEIMRKVITIRDTTSRGKPCWKKFHWVDYAEYSGGKLTIKISQELKPYLICLHELFSRYEYSFIINLPTVNSLRLFELLVSFENYRFKGIEQDNYKDLKLEFGEIAFSLAYMREFFGCLDKYPNTADFCRYVIDPAVKAICKNALYPCTYRKVKEGHSITYIVFRHEWHRPEQQDQNRKEGK